MTSERKYKYDLTSAVAAALALATLQTAAAETETGDLEAVTVYARRLVPISRVAAAVSVIPQETIERTLSADVKELVRYEPGLSVRSDPFRFGVDTFAYDSIEGETRGEWYVRQMLGSANISGPWLVHFMSGNLSHQIEHHLFPDLPSNRYAEIAPQVREICQRYGLHYVTGSYLRQVTSAWAKVFYYSVPNAEPDRSRARIVADAVRDAAARRRDKRAAKRAAAGLARG